MNVSVICPTYNSLQHVKKLVKNLNLQMYNDFELVLIDDCSNDGTEEFIHQITPTLKYKINYIKLEVNSGAGIARNIGIEKAVGDYIAFIDVDDLWLPDKLEKQYKYMEENDYVFTYTYFYNLYIKDRYVSKISFSPKKVNLKMIMFFNPIKTSTVMYSVKKLGKVYFPEIRKRQDYGLWIKILEKSKEAHLLDQYLTFYSIVEGSLSRTSKLKLIKYHWKLFNKILNKNIISSIIYVASNVLFNGLIFKIIQFSAKKISYEDLELINE